MLFSCSTLKNDSICSSETTAGIQQTAWRYTSENRSLYNLYCQNLKSYIRKWAFHSVCWFRRQWILSCCLYTAGPIRSRTRLYWVHVQNSNMLVEYSMELTLGYPLINSQVRGPFPFLRFLMLTAILRIAAPRCYRLPQCKSIISLFP
jgi:hypothetical protein